LRSVEPSDPALNYAAVLDALPIVAFMARPDGSISYVSRGWSEFTGIAADDVLDFGYSSVIHPDDLERLITTWERARASETPYRDEYRIRFGDGSYRWILSQAAPMRDSVSGAVVGWFGTVTDIEGHRRIEAALREQAEFTERLIDSSDDCIKILDLDAKLISMSANGQRNLRILDFATVAGTSWVDFWKNEDRDAALAAVATAKNGGTGRFTGYFPVEDEPRWFDVAVTPIVDAQGMIERLLAVSRDVTGQRTTQEALAASEATSRALSGTIPGVTWAASPQGELTHIGDQWISVHGQPREGALGEAWLESVYPADRERVLAVWGHSIATGEPYDTEFRVRLADGSYHWFLVRALPVRDENGAIARWVGVNIDIEQRRRADEARARLESGLRLLARTGAAALNSLDYATTLRNLAQAVVAEFASYCIIDVYDQRRRWERTVVHRDARLAAIIETVPEPSGDHPIARALRTGEASVVTIDDNWAESIDGGIDRHVAVDTLGVRSFITVPVVTPANEVVGALTCALDATAGREAYVAEELAFVEEVGRRAGAAIANARLYERERRIAVELQAASLPAALPRVEHLDLDAEYRPGSDEATIGGDWYDAFALEDGRVAITVGDVLGHGLHAAVTMTKLRQAMQSAAMVNPDPNLMLDVADRTLRLLDPDGYATALAGIFDGEAGTLTFASAGHPGPALRTQDGRVLEFTSPGLMLGLRDGRQNETELVPAAPGSTIVFYTDGLVEATRDIDVGHRRLHEALERADVVNGEHPARAIVAHVLGGDEATDDIAVLVARIVSR
jgi:PAS domain S-box-containing protein